MRIVLSLLALSTFTGARGSERLSSCTRAHGMPETGQCVSGRLFQVDSQPASMATVQEDDRALTQQANQAMAQGGPLASPRDTVRATIGKAHVVVDYGRPFKRGRAIFGALVPYNSVWRTGANAATVLTTDHALKIGTLTVPPGSYTLYTIPSVSRWQLIINREVGQWGLVYHPEYDLGHTAMTVSSVKKPLEQLTIDFTAQALRLRWDTIVVQLPISGS